MSKVVIYTLESDGTVPDFVLDGGYFPCAKASNPPQDWSLVGIAADNAPNDGLTKSALVAHVESFCPIFHGPNGEQSTVADVVHDWWAARQ